uniref:Serine/arginine-rich splicing factor RS2Z33-like n=1 Tax=Phallusia mammillata TaxID=59560 RepID=A0A6F9DQG2_9ASCI|nr:serine/arginine-rich splicing factor RS2Z33-like [Phallusia mammillata]
MFGMNKGQPVQGQPQISSQTSDPETAFMRVFVGNLNTLHITKKDLRTQFAKYGYITAISIHRGFAFVQYNNPKSARNAVHGENGTFIGGQQIDINIAAEPKPNQKPQGLNTGVSQSVAVSGKIVMNIRGRGAMGSRGRGRGVAFGRGALTGLAKVQAGRVEKHIPKKPPVRKSPQVSISDVQTLALPSATHNYAERGTSFTQDNFPLELIKTELLVIRQKVDFLLTQLPNGLSDNA